MSTPLNAEDVARRLTTKATIEDVLRDPLTEDFGQGLKAAQITLAIEGQIASIIAATRTAAFEEAAVIADRSRPEIGSHINGSPYRSGKYDAAVLVAVAIRAAKDGAQ